MEKVHFLVKAKEGSRNRYNLGGKVPKLEEVLRGQLVYPGNYGIVLRTHCDDGEPLDGFVLTREAPVIGSVVEVKPLGVLRLKIDGMGDEKMVSTAVEDPDLGEIESLEELKEERSEEGLLEEIENFFETYGYLNDEDIKVVDWFGKERVEKLLEHSRKLYKRRNK